MALALLIALLYSLHTELYCADGEGNVSDPKNFITLVCVPR